MKQPLLTGAYEARSLIAGAQRCVNLYLEQNPADSEFPTTHQTTPGLVKLGTAPTLGWRGLFTASNGELFGVAGSALYVINSANWTFEQLGLLATSAGFVSMNDNSITLVVVDGSPNGATIDLETHEFNFISDAAFYGSSRVDVIDDFMIFNQPTTRQFYVSGALAVTFDPLDIASKNGAPDKTVACAVVNRRIWIFGEKTTEFWYNAGAADFAFVRDPGVFIEHGCAAAASIAKYDTSIYWVAPEGMIFRTSDTTALRISTHALEQELRKYATLADAQGYCYEDEGHIFYVLTFPGADKTWVFDLATNQWHERLWLDDSGLLHRHRSACYTLYKGMRLVGDWETGDLYQMTPDAVDDAGQDMLHVRSWPAVSNEKKQIFLDCFIADMEVGEIPVDQDEPVARLRWSDDRGRSWGNAVSRGMGAHGKFGTIVQFNRLGQSVERVFELSWSAKVKTALNGGYLNPRS